MNDHFTTGYFQLEGGTRQGDSLSAYLFILVSEVLLIQIRNCQDTEGILINDAEVKTSAYADSSYFFLRDTFSTNHMLYKTHFH